MTWRSPEFGTFWLIRLACDADHCRELRFDGLGHAVRFGGRAGIGLAAIIRGTSGRRRYEEAVLTRLEVIGLCKAAGFSLDEIRVLLTDDGPGRPASRALAEAKLTDIDTQMATLVLAREIIEWAMSCPCSSVDACDCGTASVSGSPC
jgi:DNA-binding transcriptional MerR regulator